MINCARIRRWQRSSAERTSKENTPACGRRPGQGSGGKERTEPVGAEGRRKPSLRIVNKKIGRDDEAIDRLLVDYFLEAHDKPPLQIILDAYATGDPTHGNQ